MCLRNPARSASMKFIRVRGMTGPMAVLAHFLLIGGRSKNGKVFKLTQQMVRKSAPLQCVSVEKIKLLYT